MYIYKYIVVTKLTYTKKLSPAQTKCINSIIFGDLIFCRETKHWVYLEPRHIRLLAVSYSAASLWNAFFLLGKWWIFQGFIRSTLHINFGFRIFFSTDFQFLYKKIIPVLNECDYELLQATTVKHTLTMVNSWYTSIWLLI